MFATVLLAAGLLGAPLLAVQNPEQQPTSNPDAAKQRTPTPPSPGTGDSQQPSDVPHQQPDAKNPDMGQQRQRTPKKKTKHKKSTAPSSTTPT
jgi:hypothetical protein